VTKAPTKARQGLLTALLWGAAFVFAILLMLAPSWWEGYLYRQTETLAGVGAALRSGGVTSARRRIDPGRKSEQILRALGRPSMTMAAEGTSSHEVWTYYYADGTMTVNLTDGIAQRISLTYGPPRIPTSRRPQ